MFFGAVCQRSPEVLFRLRVTSSEQAGDLVVPPAERPVRRSLLECRIQPQRRHQLVADFAAVLEALAKAERLRQATHVGGNPEVTLGTIRFQRHRGAPRSNAAFEEGTPFFVGRVTAKPVIRARQPGGGFEVLRVLAQARFPDLCRPLRAREVGAVRIERVGIADPAGCPDVCITLTAVAAVNVPRGATSA